MAESTPKHDLLLEEYLTTIDEYQAQLAELHKALSAGYLNLAAANFHARGVRYGQDYYDQRMVATRGVSITEDGALSSRSLIEEETAPEAEEEAEDEAAKPSSEYPTSGLRRRKGKSSKKPNETSDSEEEPLLNTAEPPAKPTKPTPAKPRDPLRWFGILVPPDLRNAQISFVEAVECVYPVLSTRQKLDKLAAEVEDTRDVFKIYTTDPREGDELPQTELDEESGYVHLCTSSQVLQVIAMFMSSASSLYVLRIPHEAVSAHLKWEDNFPHFYGTLLRSMGLELGHITHSPSQTWEESWSQTYWTPL